MTAQTGRVNPAPQRITDCNFDGIPYADDDSLADGREQNPRLIGDQELVKSVWTKDGYSTNRQNSQENEELGVPGLVKDIKTLGDVKYRVIPEEVKDKSVLEKIKRIPLGADVEGKLGSEEESKGMPELKDDQKETNDEEIMLDLNEAPAEVMEYARRVLGESDEVKCQTIQELRDMIYERGECLPHRTDDAFLIRFLRARNFNVQRAHRLVVNYYNFKEEHPEIHQDINPLEMKHIGDDDVMTVPAYRTQCGRRLMIYRIGNWNPRKYSVEEIFKATVIILELGVLEPRAQILGGVAIFDFQGITMGHAWTITPQVASMVMSLMVSAFPMKTHAIHILHQSWVFDAIFAVFKPLLDTRMQDKIFFHGSNLDSLHKHISPTSLPKKYGGTREELHYYKWIESLGNVPKIVREMQQLGYVVPEEMHKHLDVQLDD